jgi:hypothetical protein
MVRSRWLATSTSPKISKDRSYVAIVCVHPAGGVKEQTAGLSGLYTFGNGGEGANGRRAGSRDKRLHIVEGATHIAMYDTPEFVKQAMSQLVPLYQNAGKASSASNFVGPLSAHAATDVAASAASVA